MLKRLDNIGVAAKDVAAMHAFYSRIPGCSVAPLEPGAQQFSVGLPGLSLFVFGTSGGAGDTRSTDYLANPRGLDHLAFEVDDIEATGPELERAGVTFEGGIVGAPGEFRYRGFKDPDGNMLYIIQHA